MHRAAGAGTLDPSFGDDGVVDFSTEAVNGIACDLLALPGGQMLYADRPDGKGEIRLRRLNANGLVDNEFGGKGSVDIPIENGTLPNIKLTWYRNEGWLLTWTHILQDSEDADVHVVRLDLNGQPVISFGDSGRLKFNPIELLQGTRQQSSRTPISDYFLPLDASVQPDGKIVLAYGLVPGRQIEGGLLVRLNADGSFDKSFNGTGYLTIELAGVSYDYNVAERVVVQTDGKILAIGTYYNSVPSGKHNVYVARFNHDGQPDPDFNNGRAVTIAADARHCYLGGLSVRKSDGAIVLAGYKSDVSNHLQENMGFVAVLNANGTSNLVFNGGKPLISGMLQEGVRWDCCAWQQDGQAIIVGGSGGRGYTDPDRSVLTARFLLTGALDPSYSGKGWATYKHSGGQAGYAGMALAEDNKLVLCCQVYSARGCALRYLI
jgi:uncharacterized delta-60 repeat protein